MSFYKEWLTSVGISTALAVTPYKVTNGIIGKNVIEVLNVESPTSRVDFNSSDGERIDITTRYKGPSDTVIPFASGAVVSQYGLKLRSVNTCNLVYIMHIFTPKPLVSISYKLNEGMSTHEECGANGYFVVKNVPVAAVPLDTEIRMQAHFTGNILTYKENGVTIWSGTVPFEKKGISGFRSDNVKVSFNIN